MISVESTQLFIFALFVFGGTLDYSSIHVRTQQMPDWRKMGRDTIEEAIKRKEAQIEKPAKNVVLVIGDGMGLSTLTATRIFKGEKSVPPSSFSKRAEMEMLSFEKFPNMGLLKTYSADYLTSDSSATASAMMTGEKVNCQTISVNSNVKDKNCASQKSGHNNLESVMSMLKRQGRRTGFVTTARVTHATPATTYAHSASRKWEASTPNPACKDIAAQLIDSATDWNVAMGGGLSNFYGKSVRAATVGNATKVSAGTRKDSRDLLKEWQSAHNSSGRAALLLHTRDQLVTRGAKQSLSRVDHVLGLFTPDHFEYAGRIRDASQSTQPSLEEMTEAALHVLTRKHANDKGFFLMVEGGLIDQAHHYNLAQLALTETLELDKAVQKVLSMTDPSETLIIVVADHSHGLTLNGPTQAHVHVAGLNRWRNQADPEILPDGKPRTILAYSDGPGFVAPRKNYTNAELINKADAVYPALTPNKKAAHTGEDVTVYARGPWSHLFHTLHEQHYVAHVMMLATCSGNYTDHALCTTKSSVSRVVTSYATSSHYLLVHTCLVHAIIRAVFS